MKIRPTDIELTSPPEQARSPEEPKTHKCTDLFCSCLERLFSPHQDKRAHSVHPPSPAPATPSERDPVPPAGAGKARVVFESLFGDSSNTIPLFSDSPPSPLKKAESLEDIRLRLASNPRRERAVPVKDFLKRDAPTKEDLFRQIDRDIIGSNFTIDGKVPKNAASLCKQLREKTEKGEEEILSLLRLCHQGVFASGIQSIKENLGLLDLEDSDVEVTFGDDRRKPSFNITTNETDIFLTCSYEKTMKGSVQDHDPEPCGTLEYSLMISSDLEKAIESWQISPTA